MSKSNNLLGNINGFLLLEVLVCVIVLSIGLAYVVSSFSSSTRAIETGARFLKSISLAESKMWELEAQGGIKRGRDADKFREKGNFYWQIEVEGLKDFPLNLLRLSVEWRGVSDKKQKITLVTYLWNEE